MEGTAGQDNDGGGREVRIGTRKQHREGAHEPKPTLTTAAQISIYGNRHLDRYLYTCKEATFIWHKRGGNIYLTAIGVGGNMCLTSGGEHYYSTSGGQHFLDKQEQHSPTKKGATFLDSRRNARNMVRPHDALTGGSWLPHRRESTPSRCRLCRL